MIKMSTDRGLGFPFTTFCPYLRQRYPSSKISTSLTVCTTTRGSRFGLPIKAASMPADSIFLVIQQWSTALAINRSLLGCTESKPCFTCVLNPNHHPRQHHPRGRVFHLRRHHHHHQLDPEQVQSCQLNVLDYRGWDKYLKVCLHINRKLSDTANRTGIRYHQKTQCQMILACSHHSFQRI